MLSSLILWGSAGKKKKIKCDESATGADVAATTTVVLLLGALQGSTCASHVMYVLICITGPLQTS